MKRRKPKLQVLSGNQTSKTGTIIPFDLPFDKDYMLKVFRKMYPNAVVTLGIFRDYKGQPGDGAPFYSVKCDSDPWVNEGSWVSHEDAFRKAFASLRARQGIDLWKRLEQVLRTEEARA